MRVTFSHSGLGIDQAGGLESVAMVIEVRETTVLKVGARFAEVVQPGSKYDKGFGRHRVNAYSPRDPVQETRGQSRSKEFSSNGCGIQPVADQRVKAVRAVPKFPPQCRLGC